MDQWSFFSGLELSVVQLLVSGAALSAAEIARALGESEGGRLRAVLPSLVDRAVLRVMRDGYQLNAAPAQLPAVVTWLESIASPTLPQAQGGA